MYKFHGHPEGFQLETQGPRIFANVADAKSIQVINRSNGKILTWPLPSGHAANFPMVLDEADRRVFIGTRKPSRLTVLDMDSGKIIASVPTMRRPRAASRAPVCRYSKPKLIDVPVGRTSRISLRFGRAAIVLAWLSQASPAHGQTDEIQVYDAAIAATHALNLTLHDNYTPSGSRTPALPGGIATDGSLNGVAEWAYGVANWFEAGLYLPLYSITRNHGVVYDGMKLRALIVTPNAEKRQFFYGVNFEFSFNTAHWDERAHTSEIRPIVGAHLGRFDVIFNPIVDNAWNGFSKLEFVPATRVAMAVSEKYKIALEEYDDFGSVSHFLPAAKQSHQLFGVVDINTPWIGIEAGVGAGLTNASDHWVLKLILSKDL